MDSHEITVIARRALVAMRRALPNRVFAARRGIVGAAPNMGKIQGKRRVAAFRRSEDGVVRMELWQQSNEAAVVCCDLPADLQAEAGAVLDAIR